MVEENRDGMAASGVSESVADRLTSIVPSENTASGYLLRLSRPRFWPYLGGPALVAVVYAANGVDELVSPLAIALVAYFLIPANVFLYGVNDAFDADIDAVNPKKTEAGPEVQYRDRTSIRLVVLASGLLGLGLVPWLPWVGVAVLIAYYFLAIEYSAPPLRFKTTPFFDSLSNGLYVLPGVVAFAAIAGRLPPMLAIAGGWFWTMAMHTFSAIPDIEPDRAVGIRTTATVLGEGRTHAYCVGAWLASAVAFGLLDVRLGALLGVYPIVGSAIALSDVDVSRAYWWFPGLNTVVGALFTMGGLWVMIYA
ncbi:MAG: 4-hydroxybenzoate polyprenyltransferase [Halobacteriales archaeon]|jgi:4-hydroxybenzoate polyprenyltransferase